MEALLGAGVLLCALVSGPREVITTSAGSNVGWQWLVTAPYWIAAARSRPWPAESRVWSCAFGACAFGLGIAVSRSVVWAGVTCALHALVANRSAARHLARGGRLPVPTFFVLGVPLAGVLLMAVNPVLWGAPPATIVSFVLSPLDAPHAVVRAESVLAPNVLLFGAALGAAAAAWCHTVHPLPAHTPKYDSVWPLIAVGALVPLSARLVLPPAWAPGAPPPELSWSFLAMAVGSGVSAVGLRARRALDARRALASSAV
jgi:hypothetical protein